MGHEEEYERRVRRVHIHVHVMEEMHVLVSLDGGAWMVCGVFLTRMES